LAVDDALVTHPGLSQLVVPIRSLSISQFISSCNLRDNDLAVFGGRRSINESALIASCAGVLSVFVFFLGGAAGFAINTRIINVTGMPEDLSGGCLLAQPLTADTAMRMPLLFILFHGHLPLS
jgi:hypothetical protein